MDHPSDNLVRSLGDTRAKTQGDGHTLYGHFAVFDTWTEIHSFFEGDFLERIAPGAFAKTITGRRDQVKVLYDHGGDPQLGNKPLGAITQLREDKVGAYYEVDLLNRPYVDDIAAAAAAGLLGSSFRFKVTGDSWVTPDKPSDHNPQMLDERTINAVDLYEFGPVTFPAYSEASALMRSGTDDFLDRLAKEPRFVARFAERTSPVAVESMLAALPKKRRAEPVAEPADPDEDPLDLAEAIDAVLDAVHDALDAGNTDQAMSLLDAAEVTVDALIILLGGVDPDDRSTVPPSSTRDQQHPDGPASAAPGDGSTLRVAQVDDEAAAGAETCITQQERAQWIERHVLNPPERPIAPPVDEADKADVETRRRWVGGHVRHIA